MYKNYKVVANTAAGRRRYMQYLIPYILTSQVIDQYDIWVNTNNGADIEFFRRLANIYPKINLVWQPDGFVDGISSINAFYKRCTDIDTIYFKLDDDIIWMEQDTIDNMVKFRVDHPDYFFVSPLVINNALCTYLLQVRGKINLSHYCISDSFSAVLWRNANFANSLHLWFINHIKQNNYNQLHIGKQPIALCRFSINAILWFGKDLRKIQGIVPGDDEEFLSCIYPSSIEKANCINGDTIMAHFAFYPQRKVLDQNHILDQYGLLNLDKWRNEKSSITTISNDIQQIMKDIDALADELEPISVYTNVPQNKKSIFQIFKNKIMPQLLHTIILTIKNEKIYNKVKVLNNKD